jgi:hypothetical protein
MPQPTVTLSIAIFAKQNPMEAEYRDGLFVINSTREEVSHTMLDRSANTGDYNE